MLQKARGKQTETRETSSLIEVKRTLEEAREILRGLEGTALAGVAAQLSTATESLAETAAVLHKIRLGLWVDREVFTCVNERAIRLNADGQPSEVVRWRVPVWWEIGGLGLRHAG